MACLSVLRITNGVAKDIKVFVGQEAKDMYAQLTGIMPSSYHPDAEFCNHMNELMEDEIRKEFCNHMNELMEDEIRKEYFSGVRTFAAICEFWNITGEELERIITNEHRNIGTIGSNKSLLFGIHQFLWHPLLFAKITHAIMKEMYKLYISFILYSPFIF